MELDIFLQTGVGVDARLRDVAIMRFRFTDFRGQCQHLVTVCHFLIWVFDGVMIHFIQLFELRLPAFVFLVSGTVFMVGVVVVGGGGGCDSRKCHDKAKA